jgi:membrane protein
MSSGDGSRRPSARTLVSAVRGRYAGSAAENFVRRLGALDFVQCITVFGAVLLMSALPFVILMSSLANHRIDVDVSRHIGLDSQGANIVGELFASSSAHPVADIVIALIIATAGVRAGLGPVGEGFVIYASVAGFFWWSMYFLLAGRVSWRVLVRPALLTALLWVGLELFSSVYFSSEIVSDSRLYGKIGVVFSLLTWFMAIGAVIVLGTAMGATWEERKGRLGGRETGSGPAGPG